MPADQAWQKLDREMARREKEGVPVHLWLRDDDATEPTPALAYLLGLTGAFSVPVAIAIIPGLTGEPLAQTLATARHAAPVVHGWTHANHAPPSEKKQELGMHRPLAAVQNDLSAAIARMTELYGDRLVPMLVPPWNRIRSDILPHLQSLGFQALSCFGFERPPAALPVINTHVDLIDWQGTRGCRDHATLIEELLSHVGRTENPEPLGLLSHHLVHDAETWAFMQKLFALTSRFSCVKWLSAADLFAAEKP